MLHRQLHKVYTAHHSASKRAEPTRLQVMQKMSALGVIFAPHPPHNALAHSERSHMKLLIVHWLLSAAEAVDRKQGVDDHPKQLQQEIKIQSHKALGFAQAAGAHTLHLPGSAVCPWLSTAAKG